MIEVFDKSEYDCHKQQDKDDNDEDENDGDDGDDNIDDDDDTNLCLIQGKVVLDFRGKILLLLCH